MDPIDDPGVGRVGDDDLVAGAHGRQESVQQSFHPAAGDDDLALRVVAVPGALGSEVGDRLPQRHIAGEREPAVRLGLLERLARGRDGLGRERQVGVQVLEAENRPLGVRPGRPLGRGSRLHGSDLGDERRDHLGELLAQPFVDEPVALEAGGRVADGDLAVDDPRAGRAEDLAQLGLCPHGPEGAGAGADDSDRLVPERVPRERPRDPVDRVLELARDGRVVLRGREEDGVRACDRRAKRNDGRRRRLDVVLLVVGRNRLQALPQLELDSGGEKLGGGAQQLRVVRLRPEAARDCEDLHDLRPP